MEQAQTLLESYRQRVIGEPERYFSDYQRVYRAMQQSTAKYKGKVIDFLYQPFFVTDVDHRRFSTLVDTLTGILRIVVKEYLTNRDFRPLFGFDPVLEALIDTDPGYNMPFPMARFDLFYSHDDDFKFCELNADGTSAMNESNTLERIYCQSEIMRRYGEEFQISYGELFDTWADELLQIYREWDSNPTPTIAIVDFKGLGTPEDFNVFQRTFEQRGCKTVIADPRELSYRSGRLYFENEPLNLIYRRAVTRDVIQQQAQVTDFLNAYRDGNICVIGPFRSQIIHNKVIFQILHEMAETSLFTVQQREFIRRHIPRTSHLSHQNINWAREHKDQLVLKPQDSYAAKGVVIGRDFNAEEWHRELVEAQQKGQYLLQDFAATKPAQYIVFKGKTPHTEPFNTISGLFVYNGQYRGMYTRAGQSRIIASLVSCAVLPNIRISPR